MLQRLLVLGGSLGTAAGLAVWAAHGPLISFFTSDPAVVAHVSAGCWAAGGGVSGVQG